jgi:hypothetical protein
LIGRHRKGLLFHAHLTIEGSVALTFFSVALIESVKKPSYLCRSAY